MKQFTQTQLLGLLKDAQAFSDERIKTEIAQIGRNGEPEDGTFRHALREGCRHILRQRQRADGVEMVGEVMHHPV